MQKFDLLTNLISKANWYSNLFASLSSLASLNRYYRYIYVYALGIILAVIIIIRAISNDGGQAKHRR